MKFQTDHCLPLQRPWKEALAIYRQRFAIILPVAFVTIIVGLLLVCAPSLEHLTPRKLLRIFLCGCAILSLFGYVSHFYVRRMTRKSRAQQKREEIERILALLSQSLREHDMQLPPLDMCMDFKPRTRRPRILVPREDLVLCDDEENLVCRVMTAIKWQGHLDREENMYSHGQPALPNVHGQLAGH